MSTNTINNNPSYNKRYLILGAVGTITAILVLFEVLPPHATITKTSYYIPAMMRTTIKTIHAKLTNNNIISYILNEDEDYAIALGYALSGVADLGADEGAWILGGATIVSMNDSFHPSNSSSKGGSSSRSSTKKLVHSTFRIEQDVIKALEKAAEKRNMTLSSMVNTTLKNYVTSEMYFEELGFILVSKNLLRKIFDGLTKEHVEEIGKEYGLIIAREYMCYFYPIVNSDTLVQFLKLWFRRFQSYRHSKIDSNGDEYHHGIDSKSEKNGKSRHHFTVTHDINMNFTLALQSILAGLIEPIIKNMVEFTNKTPNAITFSFEV